MIPRLSRFQKQNPEIDVRLTASLKPVDFNNSDVHGAVRAGSGEWPVRADKLCETYLVPVCSPSYAASDLPLRGPEDLDKATLLHSLGRPNDWLVWLDGAGFLNVDLETGHRFASSSMAYQAAQCGLGVALGQRFLIEDDLRAGLLVAPIEVPIYSDETYYFLSSPRYAGVPILELFRAWLIAEAQATNGAFGGSASVK
ncbi:MAG: hypothetical protein KUA43_17070 [Hoeflea sp.]|nr:hypothetical protein [Alphaproteobacteria bacterium]MBU4543392.1 hypothetical protein [Alphaproteobacteria bacterium]MBU4549017.1 hypothetical protein [Alphaproteobacteria bacterium]MBV1725152.1 hypothetical protein [Hoeflea sp.]MBV1785113.1 hypothetical protein [Hoeflea sp.]